MNDVSSYVQNLASSDWVYAVIFLVALAEASVITSYFLSGTLAFVVVGALISREVLDPFSAILAVYLGTVIGDISSFVFSRTLQRIPLVAAIRRANWLRTSLSETPARFILICHFAPYLRALTPVLAAGVVPFHRYLAIELVGAMLGTLFLIGIGYFGAEALAILDLSRGLGIMAAAATCVLVILLMVKRWIPPLPEEKPTIDIAQFVRTFRAYLLYPFWHPSRWIEQWLRGKPSRELRRCLQASFPDVQPGDIFLIRLHMPAPWGRWAHSAMAIDAKTFCHGFASIVTTHALSALPVRYAIAHLRVRCSEATLHAATETARAFVGTRVSVFAYRNETERVSCASLIAHAYRRSGIELVDPRLRRIAPDDLFSSPEVDLIRIINTEKVRLETRRYVFEAREEG